MHVFIIFFYAQNNIWLYLTHKMTISQFFRACSNYDVIVRSYINGWYVLWYQWKEDVHSYTLVVNLGLYDLKYDNLVGVSTPP